MQMTDGTKIEINSPGLSERLLKDKKLTFYRGRDRYTSKPYKNLKFTLHDSGRVEIAGSLHMYFNDGAHNWNDFTRVDLWDVIHDLCQWLKIAPTQAKLHNLEFGVNVVFPFNVEEFLGDLLSYKTSPFCRIYLSTPGTAYQTKVFGKYLKCYDKGTQYERPENIFRFELKITAMRNLRAVGIHTLQDLMQGEKLAALGNDLLKAWEFVLVKVPMPLSQFTAKEQRIVEAVIYNYQWKNLSTNQRCKYRKEYGRIVERYLRATGENDRRAVVERLLYDKWEELLMGDVCNDLQPAAANSERVRLQRLSIVSIPTQSEPTPATPPPPPEEFLTTAQEQQQHRVNKRRRTQHTEQYYIDHNERNSRSNPPHNFIKSLERAVRQTTLFDPLEVIRLKPEQRQLLNYFKGTPREIKGLWQPTAPPAAHRGGILKNRTL